MDSRASGGVFLALVAASHWAAACLPASGGIAPEPPGDRTTSEPPDAPSGLAIEPTAYWGVYRVTWLAPAGAIDGYEFEGRAADAPFAKTHEGLFPASATDALLYAWDEPELVRIELRIRAVRGGSISAWSEIASIRQPLEAPDRLQGQPSADGVRLVPPIEVTWRTASTATTEFLLERADAEVDPAAQVWTQFPPLPATQTSYSDGDVEDGGSYVYRLRGAAQGVTSDPITSNHTLNLDFLSPEIVQVSLAQPAGGGEPVGFWISWINRSATADTVAIERQDAGWSLATDVGLASAASGVYFDLQWPQWPGARYRVRAFRGGTGGGAGLSGWFAAPPFRLGGGIALDASAVEVPPGDQYLRDDAGDVHVLRGFPIDPAPALYRPVAGGYEEHALDGDVWMIEPGLDVDPDLHPHVMHFPPVPPGNDGSRVVSHVWHDGAAWQRDEIALEATPDLTAVFAAGPGGSVHLVYVRQAAGGTERVHALRRDGIWTRTVLPPVVLTNPAVHLRAARDGTAYLALSAWPGTGGIVLMTRPPGGAWSAETVPGAAPFFDAWLVAGDAGRAGLFLLRLPRDEEYWFVGRQPAGWVEPVLVATAAWSGSQHYPTASMSRDGGRAALTVPLQASDGQAQELLVRGPAGTWHQRIGPWSGMPRVSFDASGKASVLVGMGRGDGATQLVPLLVEP